MTRALVVVFLAGLLVAGAAAQPAPRGWDQLSPEEQRRAWENYQHYQRLPEQRKRSLEEGWQRYQAMF